MAIVVAIVAVLRPRVGDRGKVLVGKGGWRRRAHAARSRSQSRGGGREISIAMLRTSRPCPEKMETKHNAESPGSWVCRSSQMVVLSETRDAGLVEGKEWKPPPASQNTRRDTDWPAGRRVCLLSRTRLEMRLERCNALGGAGRWGSPSFTRTIQQGHFNFNN